MWLKLDSSGIMLSIQIRGYRKLRKEEEKWDLWCKTDFSFVAGKWLNYRQENVEVFSVLEIQDLAKALDNLLNDRFDKQKEFECAEPDFSFVFTPKRDLRLDPNICVRPGYEFVDIDMQWITTFWEDDGALSENYLTVSFCRTDIECLLEYLRLVMGERKESDPEIQRLIDSGVLC